MRIELEDNEFTTTELLEYLNRAYGCQFNGKPFGSHNINVWTRPEIMKLPDLYGGNKILEVTKFNNTKVMRIQHLSKEDIEAVHGSLEATEIALGGKRKQQKIDKRTLPRKQRTALYYKALGSRNQTKRTLKQSTLPDNPEQIGLKANQVVKGRKRKVNS